MDILRYHHPLPFGVGLTCICFLDIRAGGGVHVLIKNFCWRERCPFSVLWDAKAEVWLRTDTRQQSIF